MNDTDPAALPAFDDQAQSVLAHQTLAQPLSCAPSSVKYGDCAMGLLMLLAILAMAGFADASKSAPMPLFAFGGQALAAPAFLFLTGLAGREALYGPKDRFFRFFRAPLYCCLLALAVAGLSGVMTGRGWVYGLSFNRHGLLILAAPLVYALLLRPVRQAPPILLFGVAMMAHVYGVLFGGAPGALACFAPYFIVGVIFAPYLERFAQAIAREPSVGLICLPIVLAFFMVFVARAAPDFSAQSIRQAGPLTLLFGFAAAFATLTGGLALTLMPKAGLLARALASLGRAALPAAALWGPVLLVLLGLAERGRPAPSASLILLTLTALGLVFLMAEFFTHDSSQQQADEQESGQEDAAPNAQMI